MPQPPPSRPTASIEAPKPSPRQWPTPVTTACVSATFHRALEPVSADANSRPRCTAIAASAMFIANCGSTPWPIAVPVARTGRSGWLSRKARSSAGCRFGAGRAGNERAPAAHCGVRSCRHSSFERRSDVAGLAVGARIDDGGEPRERL